MVDFFYLVDEKELKEKLALTESNDVIQYIYNLDSDKQIIFLRRLENIFGETYIKITREAINYLATREV